jgi:hypothetical protein
VGATLVIVFVIAQSAPGQVGFDIEELHPIPPIPRTLPSPMPSLPPPATAGEERHAPGYVVTYREDGGYTAETATFRADVDPEGRVRFEEKSLRVGFSSLTLFGRFGFSADPFAYEKKGFMEATFEERYGMRARHRAGVMEVALEHLPRYLAAVWRYEAWPLDTRKRVLFDLWDECAEWGNPELVEGGQQARRIITAFVRRYLPEDSELGYSTQQLARLNNERTSAEPFRPYVLSSGAEAANERSEPDSDPLDY